MEGALQGWQRYVYEFTTVPSMNAMLEARMVAIKTQGPAHGFEVPGAMRAAAFSLGDLMGIIIRYSTLSSYARVSSRGNNGKIPVLQPR
jgi:hypothetical protein